MSALVPVLTVVVLAQVGVLVQLGLSAALGRLLGISVVTFSFGVGPVVLERKLGDLTVQLAGVPTGGFVQAKPPPQGVRLALWAMAGPLGLLGVALLLSPVLAGSAFLHTPVEVVSGAWSPKAVGAPLLQRAYAAASTWSLTPLVAATWAKLAALNVGVALSQVVGAFLSERVAVGVQISWTVLSLVGLVLWSIALWTAC